MSLYMGSCVNFYIEPAEVSFFVENGKDHGSNGKAKF